MGGDTERLLSGFTEKVSYASSAKYLLATTACVCFTYAGMNTLFAFYFYEGLHLNQSQSTMMTNLALFVNYGSAIIGGILADSLLGQFKNMLLGLIVSILGLTAILASEILFKGNIVTYFGFAGVFVYVLGNGIMKPSTSALLGDQFNSSEDKIRSQYFSWFYLVIQVGSIASSIGVPFLYQHESSWITFAVLTAMLFVTLLVFVLPASKYHQVKPQGNMFTKFLKVVWYGATGKRVHAQTHWLDKSKVLYGEIVVEDVKTSLRVLKIFILLPFFWGIYFQMYGMWVFLANSMNRTFEVHSKTFTVPATEILALNPIIDVFLIPAFAKGLYPFFARIGAPLTALKRIGLGIVFTSAAMVVSGFVQLAVSNHPANSVSILWIIPQIFLVSCGEVLLSVTAYEFAYTQAPKNMKGLLTAMWLLTIALGNIIVIIVELARFGTRADQYFFLGGMMGIVFFIFLIIARGYNYTEEREEAEEETSVN